MRSSVDVSEDSLAEAAAITGHVSGQEVPASLAAIESELDDEFLAEAVLAVARHVCDLRRQQVGGSPRPLVR
jgi:hypothetical protein